MFLPSHPHHIANIKFNNERERDERQRDPTDSVSLESPD